MPVFPKQTRVAAIITQAAYSATALAPGLHYPWGIGFLPDGRMIVSERHGTIRIVTQGGSIGDPLRNVLAIRVQEKGDCINRRNTRQHLPYRAIADNLNGNRLASLPVLTGHLFITDTLDR